MSNNNAAVAVGIVRHVEGAAGVVTSIDQSSLPGLPDGTVIFAMRDTDPAAGLMQEVVAVEQLEQLKSAQPILTRIEIVRLAVAVIGNSRRKLDLYAGTVAMLRAALAQSEAARVRAELALAAAGSPATGG